MNGWVRVFQCFMCLIGVVSATSVEPRDFKCPMCGKPSVDSVLMSYNNFGAVPPRDGFFAPIHAGVRICPHDLFASWGHRWDELKPGDKESLTALLKEPRVVLTEREKQIVGLHIEALKKSPWWEMLWARTCDQARKQDADHARFTALCQYWAGEIDSPEPWIRDLTKLYRDEAIKALENSNEAPHRFLRAELLRLSGSNEEAARIFRNLADDLEKAGSPPADDDEEEDRKGMIALCEEGILLIEADGSSSERISGWVADLYPVPDPALKLFAGLRRHRIGLQVLVSRTAGGDKTAGEILWKLVSRDERRLIALDDTLDDVAGAPDAATLRKCGDPWTAWFDELASKAKAGKLPDTLREDPNRERCLNNLLRFGPPSASCTDAAWQKNTLLPLVIKAAEKGAIPETGFDRDDLAFALARLADEDVAQKDVILKTILRVLMELPKPKDAPEYGIRLAVVTLAEQSAKANTSGQGIDGKWKSDWWKLAADYATGKSGVGPALANDPLVSKSFGDDGKALENLAYQLFAARKDPIWKEKILNVLQNAEWLSEEPIGYAQSLGDKEVYAALEKRAARLRKKKIPGAYDIMSLYEIKHMEQRQREVRMAALPVR